MTPSEKPKTYRLIALSRDDAVVTITLNHPPVNALGWDVVRELSQAFDEIEGDEKVGAAVVTGGDSRFFSAGADVGEFSALSHAEVTDYLGAGSDLFNRIETFPKPVVAAVNGFALGGGCELALACHLRVASDNAVFGQPEVNLGILPGYGGTQRLPRLVGKGIATELILTGAMISAERAHEIGLVNHVFPPEGLLEGAKKLVASIISKAPIAVALSLEALAAADLPLAEGLAREAALFGQACAT